MTTEELVKTVEQEKAVEEIIVREYRRAHDPTWPVAAARAIVARLTAPVNSLVT